MVVLAELRHGDLLRPTPTPSTTREDRTPRRPTCRRRPRTEPQTRGNNAANEEISRVPSIPSLGRRPAPKDAVSERGVGEDDRRRHEGSDEEELLSGRAGGCLPHVTLNERHSGRMKDPAPRPR